MVDGFFQRGFQGVRIIGAEGGDTECLGYGAVIGIAVTDMSHFESMITTLKALEQD